MTADYFRIATADFFQDWSNTGQIVEADNWSGVPSIQGFRGDGLTGSIGASPQLILLDGSGTPIDVNANEIAPGFLTVGGVAEFELVDDPTVALNGSGTADAPHIVLYLDTTGVTNIQLSYRLRDLDSSPNNSIQPVALQYRIGDAGEFMNLPAGYVADASGGPDTATLVTNVSVALPGAAENKERLQIRIMTANASGSDEWIGIDDIRVTATRPSLTPIVAIAPLTSTLTEGSGSPGQFQISRTGSDLSQELVVQYLISGSASGEDYGPMLTGTVAIAPNATSTILDITALDDSLVEGDETLILTLVDGTNYDLASSTQATITLLDNDGPPALPVVTLQAIDATASEAGSNPGRFRFTRTGDTSTALTLYYSIAAGTGQATPTADYTSLSGAIVMAAGATYADLPITAVDDSLAEATETVQLSLVADSGYTIGSVNSATVTLTDNDPYSIFRGNAAANTLVGTTGADLLLGFASNDTLSGAAGNDTLNGGTGGDRLSGGTGRDVFEYQGAGQALALANSRLAPMDRIMDFNAAGGDRIRLDYDGNPATSNRPVGLFNAGLQRTATLAAAAQAAYRDKNARQGGIQGLRASEGVFFAWQGRQFLAVNNTQATFAASGDFVVEVTGMRFQSGDSTLGALAVARYFV
ncbi:MULTISPECIES: Calx-beta domain-containing protein [unclassified Leptolyngbya]|uniref:Calx-beta domain-containing protein n=1 Tax=unclassified Leptolyngbya TaxID=2650499 RepID=UPI001687152E|nr:MULTISPECIES: Calx-beta domain-containing protein [unclassified Leptolyngbya]MBD1910137.1 hypothetical protein [Leptolyngbya sp. FACHB-8]MBD2153569.1 hypothetical protein [Leptolyngbya sp. FACHB-16]